MQGYLQPVLLCHAGCEQDSIDTILCGLQAFGIVKSLLHCRVQLCFRLATLQHHLHATCM